MSAPETHELPMKTEDRQAIERLHRTVKPIKIGPPPSPVSIEQHRRNVAATEADEFRTEAHVHTRRPLSCPHE